MTIDEELSKHPILEYSSGRFRLRKTKETSHVLQKTVTEAQSESNELLLAVIEEELVVYDDYDIEYDLWDNKKDFELYTVPIEAVALFITKEISEGYEPVMQNISDEYRKRLSEKFEQVMRKVVSKAKNISNQDYLNNMPNRVQSALGVYATDFSTLPTKYRIKTVHEAKEIVNVIERIEVIHEDELINIKKTLKKDKAKGRPKLIGTVSELNNRIKDYCSKFINISNNYKKEKVLNRIVRIVTT